MKEEYEGRLQRAKQRLNEEKARKREQQRDDASHASEMSKTSKTSYASEYSRASSRRESKGPRSEWRNKARAVIERGKVWKEEAEILKDDASVHSRKSAASRKEQEAQIDSLVERNARLNERERMLKIESDLLDAAEAESRGNAEFDFDVSRAEHDEGSLESQQSSATSRTTGTRARRFCEDTETDELSRSFQELKAKWQVREKTSGTNDPTPLRSNHNPNRTNEILQIARSYSFHQVPSSCSDESEDNNAEQTWFRSAKSAPASPASVKSSRSVKSFRSAKSEQVFSRSSKITKTRIYGAPVSPESTSAKSEHIRRVRDDAATPTTGLEAKLSYRQRYASSYKKENWKENTELASVSQDFNHTGSSGSVSSHRSKRSHYSYQCDKHDIESEETENILPAELSIPILSDDFPENGENQPPTVVPLSITGTSSRGRELSYREKSAILASMENTTPNESGTDEEGPPERYIFRQRGQVVKKKNQLNFLGGQQAQSGPTILPREGAATNAVKALSEKKDCINANRNALGERKDSTNNGNNASVQSSRSGVMNTTTKRIESNLQLNNLIKENDELKARLEKERFRRSKLDEKTTHLQLEVHQKGEEITELKKRKDVSASHKEQIYKLEDALQETNRHLIVVVDKNAHLREDLVQEQARRSRLETQIKHLQMKLQKKSDEVVVLAKELKRKEDRYNETIQEERQQREVAEAHLAKACLHINKREQQENKEIEELERENCELRHTVQRMENFLKHKMATENSKGDRERKSSLSSQNNHSNINKSRRQSGGSQPESGVIASKPTWTTAISEITTDFDFEELNSSQMGEI